MTRVGRLAVLAVFAAAAVAGIVLSGVVASGQTVPIARWGLAGQLAAWVGAWMAGVWAVLRLPRGLAIALALLVGIGLRGAALAGPPVLSDDVFRYSWDGRVQAAGIDPYAEAPAAPRLDGLREGWLWPDARSCARIGRAPGCTRINRPAERTIYPPLAEAVFATAYRAGGVSGRHKVWQVTGLLADVATMALLLVALRRWGRDVRWVALYALSPAPVLDFVNNGHVDAVAVALLIAALALAVPPRSAGGSAWAERRDAPARDVAFGLLVGAAALIKIYPGLVLLAAVGLPRVKPGLALARAWTAAAALTIVAYLPHVLNVGLRVLGYLPGYLQEERYTQGGRFLLAGGLGLHGVLAIAAAVLGFGVALLWVAVTRPPTPRAAAVLLSAALVAATPVQPWYAVSLVAVAAVAGLPWSAAITVAGYPYFIAVLINDPHASLWGRMGYGAALLVAALGAAHGPAFLARPAPAGHGPARAATPIAAAGAGQ